MNSIEQAWSIAANGISYQRAVELDGHEYPRLAVAVFRFDELTPSEQASTIAAQKTNLADAIADKAQTLKTVREGYAKIRDEKARGVKYGGQDSMIKPHLNRQKKDAIARVRRLTEQVKTLEARAGTPRATR